MTCSALSSGNAMNEGPPPNTLGGVGCDAACASVTMRRVKILRAMPPAASVATAVRGRILVKRVEDMMGVVVYLSGKMRRL